VKLSWKSKNLAAQVSAATIAIAAIGFIAFWVSQSTHIEIVNSSPDDLGLGVKALQTRGTGRNLVPAPTADAVASAAAVRLHRMLPPAPPPLPPVIAQVDRIPDKPLFHGDLIGTIEDTDPNYCFAVLRWPDTRIQLVAKGQSLEETADSPTLESVNESSATLKLGDRIQTLEVKANSP